MQSTLAPSLSLLLPFQNMFLLLNNQRPTKVLSSRTKEQFLLKDEFRPHFECHFPLFAIKVFKNMGVEYLLNQHFAQGSGALPGVVVSMGLGVMRTKLERKQPPEPPCQGFQEEQCNYTSKTLEPEGPLGFENWLISSLPQQTELTAS